MTQQQSQPQDWGGGCSCCSHRRENKSSPTPLPLKLSSRAQQSRGCFTPRSEDLFLLRHAARLTVHLWRLSYAGWKGSPREPNLTAQQVLCSSVAPTKCLMCRCGERKLIPRLFAILSWKVISPCSTVVNQKSSEKCREIPSTGPERLHTSLLRHRPPR